MFGFARDKLYRQICSDYVLTEAWHKVKSGTEVAGVDDVTVDQFEGQLFVNLKGLQEDLRRRQYHPQPVKRIYLHKEDGTRRPLGILAVRDRIVQRSQCLKSLMLSLTKASRGAAMVFARADRSTLHSLK